MHRLQSLTIHHQTIELFVPDEAAIREAYATGNIAFPYWSKVWPSAEALALFILQHPEYIAGKMVVELGAGLGLPSLVAAQVAASVLCTDHEPEAVAMARQSALHNGLTNFDTAVINWQHIPSAVTADVWLLSDVNYDPSSFNPLLKTIQQLIAGGSTILLSTPQRLMAKGFIELLLICCKKQEDIVVKAEGKEVVITVMVLTN